MPSSSALTDFSEDQLNREYLADYLTTFIRTTLPAVNTNSLVIALNSAWGAGKTSFIHMWMNKLKNRNAKIDDINPNVSENENVLESTQDFNIIYYNAWENDSCPEAIIPIICSFSQLLKEDVSDNAKCEEKKKVILNTIKILGPKVLGSFACRALHIDTEIGKEIVSCITDAASDILTDPIVALEAVYPKSYLDSIGADICLYLGGYDRIGPKGHVQGRTDDYKGRYAWCQMVADGISSYNGNDYSRKYCIIHEIGHCFDGRHEQSYTKWFDGAIFHDTVMIDRYLGSGCNLLEFSSTASPSYLGDATHDNARIIRNCKVEISLHA